MCWFLRGLNSCPATSVHFLAVTEWNVNSLKTWTKSRTGGWLPFWRIDKLPYPSIHMTDCHQMWLHFNVSKTSKFWLTLPFRSMFYRVPTPPGKSCTCVCKISMTWIVLENEFLSSKVLEFAGQWCGRRLQSSFFCYFFTTCDSDEHILLYGCCYRTVYVVSNCCLSLYVNIAGLRQGPEKMILGSWKVLGPNLRNILGQSYDNAKVTIDLR